MRRSVLLAILLSACGSAQAACPVLPADTSATAGCLRYVIAPDARRFAVDPTRITFTVTASNVSAGTCAGPSELTCGGPPLSVRDEAGKEVWRRQQPPVGCAALVRLLSPGESVSRSETWSYPSPGRGAFHVESGGRADYGRAYFEIC